ncbi:MAG: hypothetical protein MI923_03825 [Phycisphaerales bacterium]|nr:hypothetical protein [Phycisphaerales bacterium]
MLGYVLVFRPATGVGTVVTETGQTYPFATRDGESDFHGGDLVEFQVGTDERPAPSTIDQVELVQKGADRLTVGHDPLVRELYRTVHMETLVAP